VSVIRRPVAVIALLRIGLNWTARCAALGSSGAFPPSERVDVLSIATKKPATYHVRPPDGVSTIWSRHSPSHRLRPMRRSSLWRLLEEADLKRIGVCTGSISTIPTSEAKAARHVSALWPGAPFLPTRACRDRAPDARLGGKFSNARTLPPVQPGHTGKTRAH